MAIYVTSDLHFGHDREFIWQARGYNNVEEMNQEQLRKFNETVAADDEVWILGDLTLGDLEQGAAFLKQLHGHIHICLGNHDTAKREDFYRSLGWDVQLAARMKYKKLSFYLSHYPTLTGNGEDEKTVWQKTWNLCGHLHVIDPYYQMKQDFPIYHVEVDAHNGYPISLDEVIEQIKLFKDKNV